LSQDFAHLVDAARSVVAPRRLSDFATCGTVGAALEAADGDVFVGVCVDTASSLGFCAEHAATAAMLTAGQSHVMRMVAVNRDGAVLAPCGRCREFISQLDAANTDTQVLVDADTTIALRDLLPFRWPRM
jgi:cytidine deaminase